jgi:ectoine hydroxylase-related dioxygenase (phytanoyl-CoA dioxygenase family)
MHYAITSEGIRYFTENGFVVLRSVLSPRRVNELNGRVSEVMCKTNAVRRFAIPQDEYGRSFRRLMNVRQHDQEVAAFVNDVNLAEIACRLLGVSGVRISHDTAFFKPAGAPHTPVHADQYHWPVSSDRAVTAWIPLQDIALEQGPIAFYKQAHRLSDGDREALAEASQPDLKAYFAERGFDLCSEPYNIGDVSFHLGWSFHCALPNRGNETRKVLSIVYMDENMRLTERPGKARLEVISRNWCPGCEVNGPLASALNPLVFRL